MEKRIVVSNAIHNNIYVAAPNRVGKEDATNGSGYMTFYGTSFVADPWGEIVSDAQTIEDEIILAEIDLHEKSTFLLFSIPIVFHIT
ncbi:nitrilase-related carbon-nitrogen hydrolase [Brevibacillus daliensis]|uniref:nitrilase-related carbon-nitrogen hydrolase n=1 Tax=Brevibacillus daliensis TaxID=2892995 RepID=UPI001E503B7D|nr:nitrilase-related carbon-nitrogen hydrolase [Brevibacillus daliensis]